MNKKILLVIPSYGIGGTPVSTLNLGLFLNKEGYDVYVMSLHRGGVLEEQFVKAENIHVVKSPIIADFLASPSWCDYRNLVLKIFSAVVRLLAKNKLIYALLIKFGIQKINNKYDIVIACQEGFTTSFISYCQCNKKIAWIRCDYLKYYEAIKKIEPFYDKFNSIVCVSNVSRNNFLALYPNLENRTIHINNVQDVDYLISLSHIDDKDSRFNTNVFTIVSIGRYNPIKRFDYIPVIAKHLHERGLSFKWYIIGEGDSEYHKKIEQQIEQNNVREFVCQLGVKSNPHYYLSKSDLLVTLSTTEACPRVVNEAKIFHVPVVSTDFPSIYDYIEDKTDGLIASIDRIEDAICEMYSKDETYQTIVNNISNFRFDNSEIIKKLRSIL